MCALRAYRRLAGWIATLAILLASLAPSLSQALGSARGSSWIEVCTSQGSTWVEDGADGTSSVPDAGRDFEHCAFCSTHAPMLGLPPSLAFVP